MEISVNLADSRVFANQLHFPIAVMDMSRSIAANGRIGNGAVHRQVVSGYKAANGSGNFLIGGGQRHGVSRHIAGYSTFVNDNRGISQLVAVLIPNGSRNRSNRAAGNRHIASLYSANRAAGNGHSDSVHRANRGISKVNAVSAKNIADADLGNTHGLSTRGNIGTGRIPPFAVNLGVSSALGHNRLVAVQADIRAVAVAQGNAGNFTIQPVLNTSGRLIHNTVRGVTDNLIIVVLHFAQRINAQADGVAHGRVNDTVGNLFALNAQVVVRAAGGNEVTILANVVDFSILFVCIPIGVQIGLAVVIRIYIPLGIVSAVVGIDILREITGLFSRSGVALGQINMSCARYNRLTTILYAISIKSLPAAVFFTRLRVLRQGFDTVQIRRLGIEQRNREGIGSTHGDFCVAAVSRAREKHFHSRGAGAGRAANSCNIVALFSPKFRINTIRIIGLGLRHLGNTNDVVTGDRDRRNLRIVNFNVVLRLKYDRISFDVIREIEHILMVVSCCLQVNSTVGHITQVNKFHISDLVFPNLAGFRLRCSEGEGRRKAGHNQCQCKHQRDHFSSGFSHLFCPP